MADSFYGGKPGRSFIIKDRFESVADMVAAFKQGADYKKAWYDECVIIDTHNKNHPDNGKIYRRGMDYTADMGGALYIGQIVGPRAGTPYIHINTLKEVEDHSKEQLQEWEYRQYPTGKGDDGHYTFSTGGDQIGIFEFNEKENGGLVPGKEDGVETYHDTIRWTWCNIRKDDDEAGTVVYVGFEIPYFVEDFISHRVSNYDENGDYVDDPTAATRIDSKEHPYYEKWDLSIPRGIKGDALRNLRVIVPTEGDKGKLYQPSALTINEDGSASIGVAGYPGIDEDISGERQILVYDLYLFDKKESPEPITFYLGDYNKIEEITLDDDGTVTIQYTHDDNTVFERKIRWITDTTLSPDTGVFRVEYNNGTPAFETTLDWIKDINFDEDGTVHYLHTKDNFDEIEEQLIKWVTESALDPETGEYHMNFNNGEPYETTLDWIKDINVDPDGTVHYLHTKNGTDEVERNLIKWVNEVTLNNVTGEFRMKFNYGNDLVVNLDWIDNITVDDTTGEITVHHVNGNRNEILDTKLIFLTKAEITDDGIVTFYSNTDKTYTLKQVGSDEDFHVKMVTDIKLATGLEQDHRINVFYNTAPETGVPIGDAINYIEDMVVREEDYHLLVLFNDPSHRSDGSGLDPNGVDANGNKWVNNVTKSDGTQLGARIYWRDLGTIKDQSGILVGLNLSDNDLGGQDILDYLNAQYPTGLHGDGIDHKIVTYAATESDEKEFYAFDYNSSHWYYLGRISAPSDVLDARLQMESEYTPDLLSKLNTNGVALMMVTYENLVTDPLPKYWAPDYNGWS